MTVDYYTNLSSIAWFKKTTVTHLMRYIPN